MHIMINTAHQRFGGAVQVALSFILECRKFPEHRYSILVGPGLKASLERETFPENFHFETFDFGTITLRKAVAIGRTLRAVEKRLLPDVIVSTTGPTYFRSKAPQIIGFNLPLYLYPESPFIQDIQGIARLKFWFKKALHTYFFKRDAQWYVTQTDDVNSRVRKLLGTTHVTTVTNNASGYYRSAEPATPKLPPRAMDEFRFITLTSYYSHKDLELIPKVAERLWAQGHTQVRFVLTIKPEDFARHFPHAHPAVINVGPVPPRECPALYQECDAMFLPTLAECFSASYPEAMIMEKPIVTTDLGFAKSICGDAALYFEPRNADAAAAQVAHLLKLPEVATALVEAGKQKVQTFDLPEQRAQKYLALAGELYQKSNMK